MNRFLSRFALLGFFLFACAVRAQVPDLPFSTEETSAPLVMTLRHDLTYDLTTGVASWRKLEAEMDPGMRLSVAPGSYDTHTSHSAQLALSLDLHGGSINAKANRREDASWAIDLSTRLAPRDLHWKSPVVSIGGLAYNGQTAFDTALTTGPLAPVTRAAIPQLDIASIAAGPYRGANISIAGSWDRPRWKLDRLNGDVFGGRLELSGSGVWSDPSSPIVTLEGQGRGVDVAALLSSFQIPRADQIRARVYGSFRVESEGRTWKRIDFDLTGEPGSVFLHRDFILDFILPQFVVGKKTGEGISAKLNEVYGKEPMIPFPEMNFRGSLSPTALNLHLPLNNDALDILYETNVDVPLLWDAWDQLVEAGLKNVGALDVKSDTQARRVP